MNIITTSFFALFLAALLAGCAATEPPPLPPHNPANPQVRGSTRWPRNLLVQDETTLAIQKELSATEAEAKSAETMHHDMQNMPGMGHDMSGMNMGASPSPTASPKTQSVAGSYYYTCPLHPQVQSDKPGKCPICGMTLVKKKAGQ